MTTSTRFDTPTKGAAAAYAKTRIPLFLLMAALLLAANMALFAVPAQADMVVGSAADKGDGLSTGGADATGSIAVYANFPSETSWSEDLSNLFYYSDSLFASPAGTYDADLAYASVNLAAAADNSNTGGSDYSQKSKNIVRLLKDIGCSDVEANAGYTEKPGAESNIGVAIGHKQINVNGQEYRLFVVGARGGGYEKEWATNLRVGNGESTGGDHQGFQEARDATIAFVMDYVKQHAKAGEHVKVWASGYCRGGIVLNMTCAWLDKWITERNGGTLPDAAKASYNTEHSVFGVDYNSDEMRFKTAVTYDPTSFIDTSVKFSVDDVYCYPANPPQGASKADVEASKSLTPGIHNMVNPDDWYPQVAPNWDGWEFSRYGTDHDLTGTYAEGESMADHSKTFAENNAEGLASAIERLKKINPSATYTSPQFRQYFFSLATQGFDFDKDGKGNAFVSKGKEMKHNQGMYFEEAFKFILDAAGCSSRSYFAENMEADFEYLIGLTIGAPLDVREKLGSVVMKQALASLQKNTGQDISTTMGKMMIVGNLESWKEDGEEGPAGMPKVILKDTFVETLKELGIAYDDTKIDHAAGTAAKLLKGLYKKEQAMGFFSFYHLATLYQAGTSLNQAHWPEVSIAWMPAPEKKNVAPAATDEHAISLRIEGGNYPETIRRKTGEKFGPLPKLKEHLPEGSYVASWTACDGSFEPISGIEDVTDESDVTDALPESFVLVANVKTLPSRTVKFYANLDGAQETTGKIVFEAQVYENGKVHFSDAAADEKDTETGIVRYTAPERDDFAFIGWSTKAENGSTSTYYPGDATIQYASVPEGGLDLFAAWSQNGLYTVEYQGNGGTVSGGKSVTKHATGVDSKVQIKANQFTRSGYSFTGWNTKADGSGVSIAAGSTTTLSKLGLPEPGELEDLIMSASTEEAVDAAMKKATVVLYAQWKFIPLSIAKAKVTGISAKKWTGKARGQKPVVKLGGKTLKKGTDYTLSYKSNKNVGKAKVTIKGKGNYTGTISKTFKIYPKGTSVKKLKAGKKAIKVTWKKQAKKMSKSRITGYQVQVATNKKFTKNKKTVTVKDYKKVSKKITKLKAKKRYYVRVRTYKKIGSVKYYSAWTKAKRIKTR